jgi:hypothetical protein
MHGTNRVPVGLRRRIRGWYDPYRMGHAVGFAEDQVTSLNIPLDPLHGSTMEKAWTVIVSSTKKIPVGRLKASATLSFRRASRHP